MPRILLGAKLQGGAVLPASALASFGACSLVSARAHESLTKSCATAQNFQIGFVGSNTSLSSGSGLGYSMATAEAQRRMELTSFVLGDGGGLGESDLYKG